MQVAELKLGSPVATLLPAVSVKAEIKSLLIQEQVNFLDPTLGNAEKIQSAGDSTRSYPKRWACRIRHHCAGCFLSSRWNS